MKSARIEKKIRNINSQLIFLEQEKGRMDEKTRKNIMRNLRSLKKHLNKKYERYKVFKNTQEGNGKWKTKKTNNKI